MGNPYGSSFQQLPQYNNVYNPMTSLSSIPPAMGVINAPLVPPMNMGMGGMTNMGMGMGGMTSMASNPPIPAVVQSQWVR